jgi:predicted house-cleaning noncanonical NTP pyrophosphatase (MazG superfamily)
MKYNKLVRDKIPEIIRKDGKTPVVHKADEAEYEAKLKKKLEEEVAEFLDKASGEELADVMEVVYALAEMLGVSIERLEEIRKNKAEKRGGFNERIVLEEVK